MRFSNLRGMGLILLPTSLLPMVAHGQVVDVATDANAAMIFAPISKNAGPYPWTDFGVGISAFIDPQPALASIGGHTAFNMTIAPSAGMSFVPGVTKLDVGNSQAWKGSVSGGTFPLIDGYMSLGLGPISGTFPLLTAKLDTSLTANLAAALNSNSLGK